jgi:hypothetical protein
VRAGEEMDDEFLRNHTRGMSDIWESAKRDGNEQ